MDISSFYIICSQVEGEKKTKIHGFTRNVKDAAKCIEKIALEAFKNSRQLDEKTIIQSPISDTVPIEELNIGTTIRYRKDAQNIIELLSIEKNYSSSFIPLYKTRSVKVLQSFFFQEVDEIIASSDRQQKILEEPEAEDNESE